MCVTHTQRMIHPLDGSKPSQNRTAGPSHTPTAGVRRRRWRNSASLSASWCSALLAAGVGVGLECWLCPDVCMQCLGCMLSSLNSGILFFPTLLGKSFRGAVGRERPQHSSPILNFPNFRGSLLCSHFGQSDLSPSAYAVLGCGAGL